MKLYTVFVCMTVAAVAEVFFEESFDDDLSKWTHSDWKEKEGKRGTWSISGGKFPGDAFKARGLQTQDDFKFYAMTAQLPQPLELSGPRHVVLQFSVKHEQRLMPACGGGYLKLIPYGVEPKSFSNLDPYLVNFGPDICGTATRNILLTVAAIDGNNPDNICYYSLNQKVRCETDQLTHFYTLELQEENGRWSQFKIIVDGQTKTTGSLNLADAEQWKLVEGSCASPQLALGSAGHAVNFIGWELWQDKAGSIFDNVLLCDSSDEAEERRKTFSAATETLENQQLQAILDKEERFHQETTKRIQEMKAKQDAGGHVDVGDWENIEAEAKEAVAAQVKAAKQKIPSDLHADAEVPGVTGTSAKDDL